MIKPIIQHEIKIAVPAQILPEPEFRSGPEFWSGPTYPSSG